MGKKSKGLLVYKLPGRHMMPYDTRKLGNSSAFPGPFKKGFSKLASQSIAAEECSPDAYRFPMHQPMYRPMHGPACLSENTPIPPHPIYRHKDYTILLLYLTDLFK